MTNHVKVYTCIYVQFHVYRSKKFCHSSKKLEFSFINDVLRVVDALYLSNGKSLISWRTIRKTLVYARLHFDDF